MEEAKKHFQTNDTNSHDQVAYYSPIQHSIRAQGDILMTSGGSTLMFKHKTRATHPVFICTEKWNLNQEKHTCTQHYYKWADSITNPILSAQKDEI